MANNFNEILDECIDRLNRGESIDACLSAYPEQAKQLEPLLRARIQTGEAYSFTPSTEAKRAARQRFYAELEKQEQQSFLQRLFAYRPVWATVASVFVIALVGFFILRATIFTGEPPSFTIPGAAADGNFAFLVSDEVNAIADFKDLYVTVDKVGVLQNSASGKWVEFFPEVKEFDLTLLPGEKTQELWRGNIPEGEYSKVVLYISRVRGTLKADGQTIEVKLPSNKLQMDFPFQVSPGNVTSFTYDITAVKAGNAQGGRKYLLKPQIAESGASQTPHTANNKNKAPSKKTP